MNKLLSILRVVGIGLIIAAVVVAFLPLPEAQIDTILGLIGLGLICDGRLAAFIKNTDPS